MPEFPDVVVYIENLVSRVVGQTLARIHLNNPFVLRTVDPPPRSLERRKVSGVRRIGKRIVLGFDNDHFLVIHLMIAGRLHWKAPAKEPKGRNLLAYLDFPKGMLTLTEAGTKRRASLHIVSGEDRLAEHDPGGLEVFDCSADEFRKRLLMENHTLKRALTDPRLFSGIGNAYSDEILHHARLSPLAMTQRLSRMEISRLLKAIRSTLQEWTVRLRRECGNEFPEGVTAFRDGMAVHGRFGQPCPVCGTAVQRIVYAENETNYCPRCQTGGKLLADRSLSRLLKRDWPRTIDELEAGRLALSRGFAATSPGGRGDG